ncbi:MAG: 16S rRNA (cytosine(1402)-N(4))-methyltransferase RsmH [Oscillospiraceae bacterium]|nr:16S rRNA (cytosine(1402)-N(4))-methyltransferase RsmH [Oscillospiraceae bacterium]
MPEHKSVLLTESISNLNICPTGVYVDGTLGLGGHSGEIARRLTTGRLVAIDRDETAIARSRERLRGLEDRITFVHGNFRDLGNILDELGIGKINGALFDLGVSSPQLDEAERGFSYMADAPLDMRMDRSEGISAWVVVNRWSEEQLKRVLWDYGEERYAPQIAAAIVRYRRGKAVESTLELVDIIRSAMPAAALREKQHPAKRSFQALRIAVNDELDAEREMLEEAMDRLETGGRLCVITFHSLEDRIAKAAIRARENGCTCPRDFPVCKCGFVQTMRSVTRKPIVASAQELNDNPRARSAHLRVAERV